MPTSDHFNITPILTAVRAVEPASILDIGCGFGKYGVLFREYMDVWFEHLDASTWQLRLVGIEAFPSYQNELHRSVYDTVYYQPAQEILPTLGKFDVVVIADVIEHFDQQTAHMVVKECLSRCGLLIISTPIHFYAQEDICTNDYERHRCLFTAADFPPGTYVKTISLVACNVYLASSQPLPEGVATLVDPADILYLRSRRKLGNVGLPISLALKWMNRVFS